MDSLEIITRLLVLDFKNVGFFFKRLNIATLFYFLSHKIILSHADTHFFVSNNVDPSII